MSVRTLLFVLFLPATALAQGFAGLGTDADGFVLPQRNPVFEFPKDHGAHPDFRIEWWYLTANLKDPQGTHYGLQWTLFRSALAPGEADDWQSPQIWFAHAAVTTPDAHHADERLARGGIGQAGVTHKPFAAWIDNWLMTGPSFDKMQLSAAGSNFAYDMSLSAKGPLVFHGDDGFSIKSEHGQASYYYSQPFFEIEGELNLPDGKVPVAGMAWLDHEWSSQPLAEDQTGWDWFSLSFDSGEKLMGFRLRQRDGRTFTSATWIAADGTSTTLPNGVFQAHPLDESTVAERSIPTSWQLQVAPHALDVTVSAINPNAWMGLSIPYWEGPVQVSGTHTGLGYLEMTGYE